MQKYPFLTTLEAASSDADRTALRDCAKFLDRARSVASLAPLLPQEAICPLPARPNIRAGRSSIPDRLRAEIDALMANRQSGGDPLEHERRLGIRRTTDTIRAERTGLNWYVQILQVLTLIRPSDDVGLEDVARRDWLDAAAKAEVRGIVPWRPVSARTLHGYVSIVERCLAASEPTLRGFTAQLRRENDFFSGIKRMTPKNQAACLRFVRSKELQRRYFELPSVLLDHAKAGFARWSVATENERNETLRHAIIAVAASILKAVPLRRRSLLELAPFGSRPNLFIRSNVVELDLEAHQVKNREPIERLIRKRPTHSPAAIVKWFLGEPRQALLDTMTTTPNLDRLFCGMDANRLSRMWHSVLSQHGFPIQLHLARHYLASWFLHHDPNFLPLAAASLAIRRHTAETYYAFVNDEALTKRADAMLDDALALLFPKPEGKT